MLYILLSQSVIVFKLTCTSLVACLCNFEGNIGLNVRKRGRKEAQRHVTLNLFSEYFCWRHVSCGWRQATPMIPHPFMMSSNSILSHCFPLEANIFTFFYIGHVFTAVMIQQPWDNQGYLTYHPLECSTFLQNFGFISKFYTCKYNPLKTF